MHRLSTRAGLGLSACCFLGLGALSAACGSASPQPSNHDSAGTGGAGTAGTVGQAGQVMSMAGDGSGGAGPSAGAASVGGGGQGAGGTAEVPACHVSIPGDGKLLAKPPMGWSSGGKLGCAVDAAAVDAIAGALETSGLRALGFEYVIVDDCWQGSRDAGGNIAAGASFPSGLAALATSLHQKQLKLGLGTSRGPTTCGGRPGSQGHESSDAASYAAAGVDYVAVSNCNGNPADNVRQMEFSALVSALAAKSIPVGIEPYPEGQDIEGFQQWMAAAQVYRNRGDISDSFVSMVANLDSNADGVAYTRAGSFNDPGYLEIGNGGMTEVEYRAQMSLAAIMAAPLIITTDLSTASAATLAILSNEEVIAVDQDPLALSGFRVGVGGAYSGGTEVWSKPLSACGERAVALFNRTDSAAEISVKWADIGLAPGMATVRDLWAKAELGAKADSFSTQVPAHGAVLVKITGQELAAPRGTQQLSDLPWLYAANSVGPVERDLSNNERTAKDGTPLSIAGKHYDKGLGVHAASLVTYRLNGACSTFTADVGVDDEATEIASVVFQVWADGEKLFDSGLMKGKMAAKPVSVDVTGKTELSLFVDNGGDDRHQDHIDWANAKIVCP